MHDFCALWHEINTKSKIRSIFSSSQASLSPLAPVSLLLSALYLPRQWCGFLSLFSVKFALFALMGSCVIFVSIFHATWFFSNKFMFSSWSIFQFLLNAFLWCRFRWIYQPLTYSHFYFKINTFIHFSLNKINKKE